MPNASTVLQTQTEEAARSVPCLIAIYIPTLAGGGAEQSMLRVAGALIRRGYRVDLLVNRRTGPYTDRIPADVRTIELARYAKIRGRLSALCAHPGDIRVLLRPVLLARAPIMSLRYLDGLTMYLTRARPAVLVSAMFYANLLALWARRRARSPTRIVITEHNTLSRKIDEGVGKRGEQARWRYLPGLLARAYPRADAIVSVSDGVAADLASIAGLACERILTIHNPVVFPEMAARAAEPLVHPWFAPGSPPVLVAAGRLEPQKGFDTLLDAFAAVRTIRSARLLVLGEGSLRDPLVQRARALGVNADVSFCGWVDNPYAYMRRASVFVLSSVWEGLGNVLIEAMACGCPVVSTDCPHGPREILVDGRFGALVEVGNARALADAIIATLDAPPRSADLVKRAAQFSIANCADRYEALIKSLIAAPDKQMPVR